MLSRRHVLTLPRSPTVVLTLAALASGLLLIRLPLQYSAALLAALALVAACVWEPAIGFGLAIVIGPAKAYLAAVRPDLPSDFGQVFFALAVAGWLARSFLRRRVVVPRLPLLVPLALYIGVGLSSLLPAISLEEGAKELLKWIEIGVGIVILHSESERGRFRWVLAGILAAGLAQGAIGVWQFQFREHGPEHFRILGDHFRAYGTFEQPNPFGGFQGLIWPVAAGLAWGVLQEAGRKKKWALLLPASGFLLASLIILASLYYSFSRGAWLGAAAAGLAMLIVLPRRLSVGLGLVTIALAAGGALAAAGLLPASIAGRLADVADFANVQDVRGANINDVNFAIIERLAHWQAAEAMLRAHPWLGVGIGNYGPAYPAYRLFYWENALGHAHNIYLNVLAETGVAGLVTYVILWGAVIALTMRVAARATGWQRGLAIGLCGAWAHLSAHQIVDNLYVDNTHLLIAALLAVLVYLAQHSSPDLWAQRAQGQGGGRP